MTMFKRLIGLLLCTVMFLSMAMPAYATESEETTEITVTTLQIATVEEFLEFAENCRLDVYSQNLSVSLEKDIDLSGYEFTGVPIFNGIFDGKNHKISGLAINGDGSTQGLFRYLTADAIIQNVTVCADIHPGGSRNEIGAIAGRNEGQILNCSFSGSLSGSDYIGGIAGTNAVTGIIENCHVGGDVHGDHFVGGIAGKNAGVIRNCTNHAAINTTPQQNSIEISDITMDTLTNTESANTVTDIGGIAGISSGVIRGCDNFDDVGYQHMGYNIGGIVGTQSGYVVDCENHGNIQGRKEVGGIVGQMEPASLIEYTEDTLQILQGQLSDLSGLVNRTSSNAQTNANQISGQIWVLQDQTETAKEAVDTLIPDIENPEMPDSDTILAAQNTLTTTLSAMPGTLRSIAYATQTTVNGLTRDLNAVSGQISAMGETINGASENLGGSITDISDQDTPELLTGKVENCCNYGAVLADLNVGGITGAVAMENDMDIFEDWEQNGEESLNFQSEIRAVILNCENRGTVTGKKQNVGGIVGWQLFGLVKNTVNTGKVDGANADYVGGISGMSSGYIRSDWVKAEIYGKTYVGGVAGSAAIVTDSMVQAKLIGAKEKLGAILGYAEESRSDEQQPIATNYYLCVDTDPGAIDGISYSGLAEPKTLIDFMQLEDLPEIFHTVSVRFLMDDDRVIEIKVTPGGKLEAPQIPAVPEKTGYTGVWEGLKEANLQHILFDMTFEALYTAHSTVIQTEQTRENGLPIILMEGSFTDRAVVSIQESSAMPVLGEKEILLESWTITMNESGNTAHLLLPEGANTKRIKLYAADQEGAWHEFSFSIDGSYLVFQIAADNIDIALVQQQVDYFVFIIGGISILFVIAVIIVVCSIRKHRKNRIIANETADAG